MGAINLSGYDAITDTLNAYPFYLADEYYSNTVWEDRDNGAVGHIGPRDRADRASDIGYFRGVVEQSALLGSLVALGVDKIINPELYMTAGIGLTATVIAGMLTAGSLIPAHVRKRMTLDEKFEEENPQFIYK